MLAASSTTLPHAEVWFVISSDAITMWEKMSDLEEVMRTETESDEYEDLYQGWDSSTIHFFNMTYKSNRCKISWFSKAPPKLSLRIPTEHFMVRQLQQQWFLLLREWHKILRRIRRQARFRTANERNDEKSNWAPPIHNSSMQILERFMLIVYAIFFYAWYSTKCHLSGSLVWTTDHFIDTEPSVAKASYYSNYWREPVTIKPKGNIIAT